MLFLVGFFLWLSMHQAYDNDARIAAGEPPDGRRRNGEAEKTWVWPDLVYTELLIMVIGMIVLVVWGMVFQAPDRGAGQPRAHARTPARRPGTSWACRRCSSTSTPGWPASSSRA